MQNKAKLLIMAGNIIYVISCIMWDLINILMGYLLALIVIENKHSIKEPFVIWLLFIIIANLYWTAEDRKNNYD